MQTHEEYSWRWNSSRIRQQFYRWKSFAMNMGTHMSGSTVKNHISLKMVFDYNAIRKISYRSWFLVHLQLLQARQHQHPWLLQVRKLINEITIRQSSHVKVWIDKHRETRSLQKHQRSCYMNQPKSPNQIKMRITILSGKTRSIPTYWNGCKNSHWILWMTEFLNTETHTRVLLMNHL